ncbi:MAG: hypothetical protein AAFQ63_09920 [Cyanobacteria bacterium J06621_11]
MDADAFEKKILILAANPVGTSRLRLDEEVREIEEGLRRSQQRDFFKIVPKWAVRPRDVQRSMLDVSPQIVHFSGCGNGSEGLMFENEAGESVSVSGDAIAGLFALFARQIECVVLNGCYLPSQAAAIVQHIPYVVGLSRDVESRTAVEFAVGFYDALGAGRPIEFAYEFGCSAVRMSGLAESLVPELIVQAGADSAPVSDSVFDPNASLVSESGLANGRKPLVKDGLSAGARRRLEIEREELQDQFDALSEEIQFLRAAEQTEQLAPKAVLKLKKQIEKAKAQRQLISQQLSDMEDKLQR